MSDAENNKMDRHCLARFDQKIMNLHSDNKMVLLSGTNIDLLI